MSKESCRKRSPARPPSEKASSPGNEQNPAGSGCRWKRGVWSCSPTFGEPLEEKGSLESVTRTQKPALRYRRLLPVKPNHLLKLSTGAILQMEPGAQVSAW